MGRLGFECVWILGLDWFLRLLRVCLETSWCCLSVEALLLGGYLHALA